MYRVADHIEEDKKAKVADRQEGENIKQQVEMYAAAKKVIEDQRTKVKEFYFLLWYFNVDIKARIFLWL